MANWKEYKLGDLCLDVKSGGTPLTSVREYYQNGTIPWLKTKEVLNNKIYSTENYISEIGLKESSAKLIPVNSVIVAMYGDGDTAGRVAMNKIPISTNQACCNLIIDESKANSDFIYYLLRGSYNQLVGLKTGSGQQNLNAKLIKDYEILIPELPEQQAIAEVLSSLDDKIDLLRRQNKTLESLAETLFRQWFVEEAEQSWETLKFSELVKHVKPGTNFQPKRIEKGIPFLNVRNLNGGFLDYSDINYISEEEYQRVHKNWMPEENDVLISRIGTLGIVAVISKEDLPVAVHYNMINLKAKLTSYQFLYFLLKSSLFQEKYNSIIRQSVQEFVAIEDVENIEINLPLNQESFKERESNFVEIFAKIRSNKNQVRTLMKTRDELLPKLMSGDEVRLKLGG